MQRSNSLSSAGSGSTGFSSQFSGNSECSAVRWTGASWAAGLYSRCQLADLFPSPPLPAGANSQGSQPPDGGNGTEDVATELAGGSLQGSLQVGAGSGWLCIRSSSFGGGWVMPVPAALATALPLLPQTLCLIAGGHVWRTLHAVQGEVQRGLAMGARHHGGLRRLPPPAAAAAAGSRSTAALRCGWHFARSMRSAALCPYPCTSTGADHRLPAAGGVLHWQQVSRSAAQLGAGLHACRLCIKRRCVPHRLHGRCGSLHSNKSFVLPLQLHVDHELPRMAVEVALLGLLHQQ